MWGYIIGGVTLGGAVFGLIMFYNGRITRREITRAIQEGNARLSQDHKEIVSGLKEIASILSGQRQRKSSGKRKR